ncbi:DoxX family protein [Nocardia arthritidis]|uniref:DoxX family protein n=1 Tax=Nocardia arthritidis TaxID=228602 RepID=A0A6G9Y886_9NOCA|nr:DoxX family protein [Nocardia arthritidis]QIS09330.1 DoxX family protein [Nocardia arthritidis]
MNIRLIGYWAATALVAAELALGGEWDIQRIPSVTGITDHLGYPTYFLVLLGVWKLLGAAALLAPRFPLVKEWAYAGTVFVYTGAIVSHLTRGYALSELWFLVPMLVLTGMSWLLRPPNRRLTSGRPNAPEKVATVAAARG